MNRLLLTMMRFIRQNLFLYSLLFFSLAWACQTKKSERKLDELIKSEAKKNEIHNELLMGISLGMSQKEFYTYCAEKNASLEFLDGGRHHQIYTQINEGFSQPVDFYFWQDFKDNKLTNQQNKFMYRQWAAWDKETHTSHLMKEVLTYLEPHFGDDFIHITEEYNTIHYVDIDGNRRIDLYTKPLDNAYVYMDVLDLSKTGKK